MILSVGVDFLECGLRSSSFKRWVGIEDFRGKEGFVRVVRVLSDLCLGCFWIFRVCYFVFLKVSKL